MVLAEPSVQTKRHEPIDLSGAHIPGTSLSHADLSESNFSRANLTEVDFEGSNLRDANFGGANLTRANLTGTDLRGASLASAKLVGTNLSEATLDEADLSGANLSNALIEGVDLSKAKGLNWTQFLDGRYDEATDLPDYLQEEELFRLLESAYSRRPWRDEFSGRIDDLLSELPTFKTARSHSILSNLALIQISEEMREQDEGKRDE